MSVNVWIVRYTFRRDEADVTLDRWSLSIASQQLVLWGRSWYFPR